MSCQECAEVSRRHGMWHCYQVGCDGCAARGIARSLATFEAVRKEDPRALRKLLPKVFPKLTYAEARELVWRAWQVDHQEVTA